MQEDEKSDQQKELRPGILDTVSFTQQNAYLRNFNPQEAIKQYLSHLAHLDKREQQILSLRYGLDDGMPQTLENIGKLVSLTRERVRQIEKESIKKLLKISLPQVLHEGAELIFQLIEERGGAIREDQLVELVVPNYQTPAAHMNVLFLLSIIPRFRAVKDTADLHACWSIAGFDPELVRAAAAEAKKTLDENHTPMKTEACVQAIKDKAAAEEVRALSAAAIENYLSLSRELDKNPFDEWGLVRWATISPKDVGDKAFLVLEHHGQPEHYGKITELINKHHFDHRVANKESVHNELIKDDRFVLVGRGIYALKKWGYKEGIVADIITEILRDSPEPLSRDQIISKVLMQRLVKKNTIIVGLANRKLFDKTADGRFRLAA